LGSGLSLKKDPTLAHPVTWDPTEGGKIQSSGTYEDDFVKDDREIDESSVTTPALPGSAASSGGGSSSDDGHKKGTAPWFQAECKEINDHCGFLRRERLRLVKLDIQHFEDEYKRQKAILDNKEAHHVDQVAHVAAEKKDVAVAKEDVEDAKVKVEELAHCPPDLAAAKAELARLQAIANKTPKDIDDECKAENVVLEKQKCVDEFEAAEKVLAVNHEDHAGEKADLHDEKKDVAPAAAVLPPQEKVTADALKAWEDAKRWNLEGSVAGIASTCQAQRDDLLRHVDFDIDGLWRAYLKQKASFEGKESTHKKEKADAKAQEIEVADAARLVAAAKVEVKEKAHCPPELVATKMELARLRAITDQTPTDIDDECKAEQAVLVAQKCVDELNRAQAILGGHEEEYHGENGELTVEQDEKANAKAAVPPQKARMDAAYAEWLAAKALRDSAICKAPEN